MVLIDAVLRQRARMATPCKTLGELGQCDLAWNLGTIGHFQEASLGCEEAAIRHAYWRVGGHVIGYKQ